MAGSDEEDSVMDLLWPFFVDGVDLLHIADTLASHKITVDVLLLLSESDLEGLIKKVFPAASVAQEYGLKAAINSRKGNPTHGSPSGSLDGGDILDAADGVAEFLDDVGVGGYAVWGTISVAVIYRCGRIHPTASLQCIFHLKKNEVGQGRCQILVALVMANILSTQFQPFAILTDLMDDWILYWMDGSKICFFRFESRADGVSTIEDFLGGHEIEAPAGKDLLVSHFSRREKYVPPATQNMDMRLRLLAIGNEDSLFHSFQTDISTYRLGQKT